jgi:hypothetical protein
MIRVRNVGLLLLAFVAIGVFLGGAASTSSYSENIDEAMSDYRLNDLRTEGAPQQQVVNGWVARDMLEIIARQGDSSGTDERVPALLTIAVLAGIWTVLLTARPEDVTPPTPVENAGFPAVPESASR